MKLTTPTAIFLGLTCGGAFVSIAVFAALRANGRDANARIASLPLPSGAGAPAAASPEETTRVEDASREASRALEAQRSVLDDACFTPLAQRPPAVRSLSFHVAVGFDAEGKQATKFRIVPRNLQRQDVTECITRELAAIAIPAAAGPATVDVMLTLP